MKYEYLKGGEKDFEGAPDEAIFVLQCFSTTDYSEDMETTIDGQLLKPSDHQYIIAERRPITDESDLNECIGQQESHPPIKFPCESHVDYHFRVVNWAEEKAKPEAATEEFIDDFVTFGKYDRQCKGVVIDVYDVLQAFEVVNPALQHLIKKALCAGLRGHKKREQDLVEILESAKRAIELEGGK